jgi:hypothetical protein
MDVVALRRQGFTITDIAAKSAVIPRRSASGSSKVGRRHAGRLPIRSSTCAGRGRSASCWSATPTCWPPWWPDPGRRGLVAATRPWCGTCGPSGESTGAEPPRRPCRDFDVPGAALARVWTTLSPSRSLPPSRSSWSTAATTAPELRHEPRSSAGSPVSQCLPFVLPRTCSRGRRGQAVRSVRG